MGKRSNFKRKPRDFYPTPHEAVIPLLSHLPELTSYYEPCCGDGALIDHLSTHGAYCRNASDIEPRGDCTNKKDAFDITGADMFITNPPWPALGKKGEPTLSMALHLSSIAPTWFLLSADFAHNGYFSKIENRCQKIVSVGRVKWIPDSKMTGKDNCAWYLFDKNNMKQTRFYGRTP